MTPTERIQDAFDRTYEREDRLARVQRVCPVGDDNETQNALRDALPDGDIGALSESPAMEVPYGAEGKEAKPGSEAT